MGRVQVNNGVYKSGFATKPEAYEKAVKDVFDALDRLEKMLVGKDYLIGDQLTEADIRLYVTIVSSGLYLSFGNHNKAILPDTFRSSICRSLQV